MKKIIIIFSFILLLSSCDKPFKVDNSDYRPKIVVNNLFQQYTPFEIVVSNSVNVYDTVLPGYLSNATIDLFVDDNFTETLTPFGNGHYNANTIPVPGKTYRVTVKNSGYEDVSAVSKIPNPVQIADWWFIDSTVMDDEGNYFGDLNFSLNDPLEENNYLVSLQFWDDIRKEWIYMMKFFSDDQSLNQNLAKRMKNGEYLFTDNLFNGKNKSILLRVPSGLTVGKPIYLLKLYTITKDAYFYYFSKPANAGETNTSPIYTNVKNGLGIFAGRSLDVDTIK